MIHITTFTGYSEEDCIDKINRELSEDQIINILNAGGYACGVGEWRPERDGQNGCYHIELLK